MKKIITIRITAISLFVLFAYAGNAFSADNAELKVSKFLTSACDWIGKNKIESSINNLIGVVESTLDIKTKILRVKFDCSKTNCDALLKTIKDLGYHAEIVASDSSKEAPDKKEVQIKTSALNWFDKNIIEVALDNCIGVEKADLKLPSMIITIEYNPEEINQTVLKRIICKLGFGADIIENVWSDSSAMEMVF